ncbi:MAG: FAD-dependent oxidoreductase, partial [Nitratireductor sp.]|nr:FAD-dependent oxidoreductase [Nitratireductor sp.]
IIFIIPYEGEFSLIGTTDQDYAGDPGNVEITAEEIGYLCEAASEYLKNPVRESDVVWTYSGVRPLYDDGASAAQEATRDYVLRIDIGDGRAPLINIFGGKITTYRKLSEAVLNKIEEAIGKRSEPWTAKSHLPGGNFPVTQFEARVEKLQAEFPFLSTDHACRLVRSYGTEAWAILQGASVPDDLGTDFG